MTEEYDHTHFRIPDMEIKSTSLSKRDDIDVLRPISYERIVNPYALFDKLAAIVYDSREAAIAQAEHEASLEASKKSTWLGFLGNFIAPPARSYEVNDLIDQESLRAGVKFGEGHRFWLGAKHERHHKDVNDWYHSRPDPVDPKKGIILHFQTTPTNVHKLYGPNEQPMTTQDASALFASMSIYADVIEDMYSNGPALAEIKEEMKAAKREDFGLAA